MAVSGSKDFELNVAEYIEEAFERCGAEFRTGYDAETSRRSLNLLFADWANRGLNRWTIKQFTQTLAVGVETYPVGTITATVGASTSLTVGETITGSSSGTTAQIITKPTSTTLTVTVPSDAFTAGETITVDILSGVVRRSDSDIAITQISRGTYLTIPTKTTTGRPIQFYFDRQITPVLKLWPSPENSTDQFIYDRMVRLDDVDASVNTVDVPFRFYPCLAAGLAYYLALKRAPQRVQVLKALYEEEFERAALEDRDKTNTFLIPSYPYLSATG